MQKLVRFQYVFVVCFIALSSSCKLTDGDGVSSGRSSGENVVSGQDDAVPEFRKIPPNGTLISAYSALKSMDALRSVSFPSSNPLMRVNAAESQDAKNSLSLNDGAPSSGSILQGLGDEIAQVSTTGGNDVFLTVDQSGNYAIVMYVNSVVGYYFPSNGDLANCFQVSAPIGSQTLPILDCVDIGSATSIIDNGARYSNGNTVRNGSTIYYENRQELNSGTARVYYADGKTARSGSTYYWPNGTSLSSSSLRYPDGEQLYSSSRLYFPNRQTAANSSSTYYANSNSKKRGETYYYTNGSSRLMDSDGTVYYPNGTWLRDSDGNLQTEGGNRNQQQIYYRRTQGAVDYYANGQSNSLWLGIIERINDSEFSTVIVSQNSVAGSGGSGEGPTIGNNTSTQIRPPSPAYVEITGKTSNSVSLDWQSGGGNTDSYLVRSILNPSIFVPTCVGGRQTSSSQFTFSNLVPSAPYALLVCAVSSEDIMSPATVVLAMPGQPLVPPLDLRLNANQNLTVDASWALVDNSSRLFRLRYTTSPEVPVNCEGNPFRGTGTSYRISGLEDNETYFVGVCTVSEDGVLSPPAIQRVVTPVVPPPEVTGIISQSNIPRQVNLSWTSGGLNTYRYLVEIAEGASAIPRACSNQSLSFSTTKALIAGLNAGVPYTFRVCAQSRRGSLNLGTLHAASSVPVATDGLNFAAGVGSIDNKGFNVPNPATNSANCPDSYFVYQFIGTTGVDYPATVCFSRRNGSNETLYDFGGMVGTRELAAVPNPVTGVNGCPDGYSEQQMLNSAGIDASLKLCYRPRVAGTQSDVLFGGIYGTVDGAPAINPATGDLSCPSGFIRSVVFGTVEKSPKDALVYICHKTIAPPPPNIATISPDSSGYASSRFSWTTVGSGVAGYIVAFQQGNTAPATCANGVAIGNVNTYTATNLNPATTYSFRVCSVNAYLAASTGTTITITTSSAPDPVELSYDIAGAYGSTGNQAWNVINPATGKVRSCPAGYSEFIFNENSGSDYPAAVCQRPGALKQETFMDFGGMIGAQVGGVESPNPVTGTINCPVGYIPVTVLNSPGVDYSLKFCLRPHVAGTSPDVLFGGVFGSRGQVALNNPVTGTADCPIGFTKTRVWGSPAVTGKARDFDVFMCHRTLAKTPTDATSPPTISAITSNSALLSWGRAQDFAIDYIVSRATGTTPPQNCSGGQAAGNVTQLSLSGLTPSTAYAVRVCAVNSLGAASPGIVASFTTLSAPVVPEVSYDFGGAYGSTGNRGWNVRNPATGRVRSCPAGYNEFIFIENAGTDYPAAVCQRATTAGQETFYDFGGMIGVAGTSTLPNPVTGAASCPSGYSQLEVLSSPRIDASLKFCYRTRVAGRPSEFLFGGVFGFRGGNPINNPLTGTTNCPTGFTKSRVWGSPAASGRARDFDVFMCHKRVGG